LKYGKCHWSGASTTPSSAMNRPATIFLTMLLLVGSGRKLGLHGLGPA
jgi:hypothetical protein